MRPTRFNCPYKNTKYYIELVEVAGELSCCYVYDSEVLLITIGVDDKSDDYSSYFLLSDPIQHMLSE